MSDRATHKMAWQDEGMVGVYCSRAPRIVRGHPQSESWTLDRERENPATCPHCGTVLRLVWDVRLEVVEPGSGLEAEPMAQLPSGIDEDADQMDTSPPDNVAHIGGLIDQVCRRALGSPDTSNRERTP